MVRGQAVTGGSTPNATLFVLALFRRFVPTSLLTESFGEGVASGLCANEKDSNTDTPPKRLVVYCHYLPS